MMADRMTGTGIGGSPTTICVADDATAATLRSMLTPLGMRVGNMRQHDGTDVLRELETQLSLHKDDIDAIVLSQRAIEGVTGKRDVLLRECLKLAKAGIPKGIITHVIDERHAINGKGVQALGNVGITVSGSAEDCARLLARTFRLPEPADPHGEERASRITARDVALGRNEVDAVTSDPFSELRDGSARIDADDDDGRVPYDGGSQDDSYRLDDGSADGDDGAFDGIDPFADVRDGSDPFAGAVSQRDRAGMDEYADGNGGFDDDYAVDVSDATDDGDDEDEDGYDDDDEMLPAEVDERHLYGGKSGEGTAEDVMSMIAPTYGDPQWDYSEINEGIREQHGGLFSKRGGKRGGKIIGETENSMSYAVSRYIKECTAKNGGYDPPTDCKIITCYSNIGGSGKTTVSTMIGAQLVWDFDRDLLERKSSNMAYRVLVLSLNEFDDIEVKGIGVDSSASDGGLLASNEGRDVLALKNKIAECNGDPTWDDIAHCFRSSPLNYVMYLPSMTLREKFETRQEIDDQDYKTIISVCRRFFNFIIIDTPDVMYNNCYELIPYALSIADVLCLVMTPDAKSTYHMYNFLDGMKAGTPNGSVPFARDQTMLVVNKVATPGNPYVGHTNGRQIPFKDIANTFTKVFFRVLPIPMTDQNMDENIMFGYDMKVKEAASDITDTILEMIDRNDHVNGF